MNDLAPSPTVFAIFGGDVDLAWRKLVPALFSLFRAGHLPAQFAIVALGLTTFTDDSLREHYHEGIRHSGQQGWDEQQWQDFATHVQYVHGDFTDPRTYQRLGEVGAKVDETWQ